MRMKRSEGWRLRVGQLIKPSWIFVFVLFQEKIKYFLLLLTLNKRVILLSFTPPGSSQRRHSSMARIHSMTIEAPITKVGSRPSHHMIGTLRLMTRPCGHSTYTQRPRTHRGCRTVTQDWPIKHLISCARREAMVDQHDLLFFPCGCSACSLHSWKQGTSRGTGHMTRCSSTVVSFHCVVVP